MNISLKYLLQKSIALALISLCTTVANAGVIHITTKLDSAVLLMGKKTALHIEITQDKGVNGMILNEMHDTLVNKVEISDRPIADTTDIDNGRIQILKDLIIQSFDSGMYVLPPMQYVVGRDTILSNHLSLKVLTVKVDTLTTVHDYAPVAEMPFKLMDALPDVVSDYWWAYLLILLLIALATFIYLKWLRHGEIPLIPKKKPVPPYEEAMQRLSSLKQKQLWQSGQEKQYFTELTDIVRVYISRRFGIGAIEMTSGQLLAAMRADEATKTVKHRLEDVLTLADFVKFANMRTVADENEASFRHVYDFVEDTKPAPEVTEEDAENTDGENNTSTDNKEGKEDTK